MFELDGIAVDEEIRLDLHAEGDAVFLGIAGQDLQDFVDEGLHGDGAEELEQIFRTHGQVNLGPPLVATRGTPHEA